MGSRTVSLSTALPQMDSALSPNSMGLKPFQLSQEWTCAAHCTLMAVQAAVYLTGLHGVRSYLTPVSICTMDTTMASEIRQRTWKMHRSTARS